MAIITDKAAAYTVVELQTAIRRILGDTDSQRWTDAVLNEQINFELKRMSAEWGLGQAAQAMESTTLSYPGGSDSVALPSGPDVNPIFMVEDYTTTTAPIRLEFASFLESDGYDTNTDYRYFKGYMWARAGTDIAIRPNGKTMTLRIWYLRSPYAFTLDGSGDEDDGTDQHPWPVQHEELIAVGAAYRLLMIDEEVPGGLFERYEDLWKRFVRSKSYNRGPKYVRNNRRRG